jgi:uncharacterized protein (DUF1330 family)
MISMPAYLIAEHIITDAAKFEEYRTKAAPMMAKYGARYLTKGGSHKFPERPHWKPERVVIIEFPDMDRLNAWYNSAEYLHALVEASLGAHLLVVLLEEELTESGMDCRLCFWRAKLVFTSDV